MDKAKFIFFDCMETLIDLTELPSASDYALWGFKGSGIENCWQDFHHFYMDYKLAKNILASNAPAHREFEMFEVFQQTVANRYPTYNLQDINEMAEKLYTNYWKTYSSKCYAKDDVKTVVPQLAFLMPLGVVSNFMVTNGIEELLQSAGLLTHFKFVVTSISERWRKPSAAIFNTAIKKAGVNPSEIIFVGDDYTNDFLGAKDMGMNPILLDRYNRHTEVSPRITSFLELPELILKQYC